MVDEIQQAFNSVYSDGPSSSPTEPSKPRIRTEVGGTIQRQVDTAITAANDAVSMAGSGIRIKPPIRAASVANVTLSTVVNGASFGGVTVATGDRVGFFGQTNASQNGVYVVQVSGNPIRSVDVDDGDELPGASFFVNEGTLAGQSYACSTPAPIVVGTTLLTFRKTMDVSTQNAAVSGLASRVGVLEAQKTSLRRVVEALMNGWVSPTICLVGDSITWGVGASGTATQDPRTGELTDPRNNLTSPTWANLLRDYLIATFCAGTLVNPNPGVGYARRWVEFDPTTDATVRYISRSSNADLAKPVVASGNATFRRVIDIPASNSDRAIEFSFYGDEVEFVFVGLATDTEATFSVEVDGSVVGTYSHYRDPAAFRQTQAITAAFGQHKVRIWNNSNTQLLRVEMLRHNRRLQVKNQGIIGVQTFKWLPSDTLWPGISAADNIILCQLGTNDRNAGGVSTFTFRPEKIRQNLSTIIDALSGKMIVLATPPKAAPTSDFPIVPAPTYNFDTADAAQAVRLAAKDKGLSVIDHYQNFALDYATLLADGIHPNDAGYLVMFNEWGRRIKQEQADISLSPS